MLSIDGLTKRYGTRLVLDEVSFVARPGRVTAFLGPNGAGKTTTMRVLLGLEVADSGTAYIEGVAYTSLSRPLDLVGALLDSDGAHPGRSAWAHLKILALSHGYSDDRIIEVLAITGLSQVARKKVGNFSLGMKQRLGIAAAMLGNPKILILDEPTNGLDQDGILWFRGLVKNLANSGCTVLLSTHVLGEVELIADQVVILGNGRVLIDKPVSELMETNAFKVSSSDDDLLSFELRKIGGSLIRTQLGIEVEFLTREQIGTIAKICGVAIFNLSQKINRLESTYLKIVENDFEFGSAARLLE